jgi:hypothetical protein
VILKFEPLKFGEKFTVPPLTASGQLGVDTRPDMRSNAPPVTCSPLDPDGYVKSILPSMLTAPPLTDRLKAVEFCHGSPPMKEIFPAFVDET